MKQPLIIFGAGGAGRELAYSLTRTDQPSESWTVAGFVDDHPALEGKTVDGFPMLGNSSWLESHGGNVAVCVVGNPERKKDIVGRLKRSGVVRFPVVIAPGSHIAPDAVWGEGCIVSFYWNGISINTRYGDFVFINSHNSIGHDVVIGDYTTLYSGIFIGGGAQIGSSCVVGTGAIINPSVIIGNNSIIGAGAVVNRDVPDHVTVAGIPARIIKTRQTP